ncbi:acyl-CoA synthetase [Sulfitobacter sp. M57]|uniref:acyl-CoA synthetase n=1 Tax=unclassified Sulfitobacter TaxID=196795 RepID=UPI0023E16771|nr:MULTISPECIES: acyl-CoA synthetase [unclassified Sulfitobacter]MDF3414367.1 acyl-CoA synthetase [Sulfitobacter sp. KE5]MDF3420351.1 acyl-CoA synthetase [Sulfitobacter sp. KE43]MDF3432913.1 acyl-CoA synthetase [Sulfitobacter sp. KE42]MDF3458553.1 acyl-CoA synthetase [Sulfitobacter sp. S74]MDF3462453.1 acyl-CoA synthetase [Sulfitobacter sp. Ks18]
MPYAGMTDRNAIVAQMPWADRDVPTTLYGQLSETTQKFPNHKAISYQILSGPKDKSETFTWTQLHGRVSQTANMLRGLGIGPKDVVAYVLPNCNEAVMTLLGGAVAGIAQPINPLLDPEQIGSILRETGASVVVTLRPFPKTDVAEKTAQAVKLAPGVHTVLEVDLVRYLTPPKSWIVPLIRPKGKVGNQAKYLDFNTEVDKHPTKLAFEDVQQDRVAFYFHTGGTTGMPKVAQHLYSGAIYNGWVGAQTLLTADDVMLCPLPLFHVMACQVMLMGAVASGAHVVFPTPQGYRGEGVFDNIWKLVERYKVTFVVSVPTALAATMQVPVNADISSVKTAFSGSAPLPLELFRRFEKTTGMTIVEGYGMTEATCLVSGNPVDGEKKIGSIGIPFPYTDVKIVKGSAEGDVEAGVDEIGEICVSNPGVYVDNTYTEAEKNKGLYYQGKYLRTGDLGRVDADGYLWITGRSKDLIIRGGHNIDPAEIEEALLGHPAVSFAGAIGQPDAHSGELPCAFVELVEGATVTPEELILYCKEHVKERAAQPKHIKIMGELPKTAVGKIFKPDLRKDAITRIYDDALTTAGLAARVDHVIDDKKRGLVAKIAMNGTQDAEVNRVLGGYTRPWDAV